MKYIWQKQRTKINKAKLNAAVKEKTQLIRNHHNEKFYSYLSNLSLDKNTNHSLWKATKKLKRLVISSPTIKKVKSSWARSILKKVTVFDEHLVNTFKSNNMCTFTDILNEHSGNLDDTKIQDIPRCMIKEVK